MIGRHSSPRPGPGARRDSGSTSLTTVLLTPVFVVIAFMAFQAALWGHARTETRATARSVAAQVARGGVNPTSAEEAAEAMLRDNDLIANADVRIEADVDLVTVHVTGTVPGLIKGFGVDVDIVEAVPVERFR